MVTIAIAGGAGNIGQTITDVLKANPEHNVVVLSRKVALLLATRFDKVLTGFLRRQPLRTKWHLSLLSTTTTSAR
jgi:nucleoside-diphosphate-sugar epimerase